MCSAHRLTAQNPDRALRLLEIIQTKGFLETNTQEIHLLLVDLLRGTAYADKLNVNGPVSDDQVNFYLLDSKAATRLDLPLDVAEAGLFGNCGYLGFHNAVVCDSSFFQSFFEQHNLSAEINTNIAAHETMAYRRAIILWMLGHELGHLVNQDGPGFFGELGSMNAPSNPDELRITRELRADHFAAQLVCSHSEDCGDLERVLISLVNEDRRSTNGKSTSLGVGLIWDYSDQESIAYFAQKDHPAFIFRATRMLSEMAQITDDAALTSLLNSFKQHLVNGGHSQRSH